MFVELHRVLTHLFRFLVTHSREAKASFEMLKTGWAWVKVRWKSRPNWSEIQHAIRQIAAGGMAMVTGSTRLKAVICFLYRLTLVAPENDVRVFDLLRLIAGEKQSLWGSFLNWQYLGRS
ncbi:MAG: hypothetical protein JWQ21_822 [Herminiimonas sp.]|nr:hypothetical protein [Herminiimonas sp.]